MPASPHAGTKVDACSNFGEAPVESISKNWMLFDEMRREMLGEHISQAEEKLTTLRHAATQSSSQAMLRATQSPPPRVRPTTAL